MSDDLIRREDAIRTVCEYDCHLGDHPCEEGKGCYAVRGLRKLPSIDRPQGENVLSEYKSLFECSVCGASCDDTYTWDCEIRYCPNCGARMKGADNEN